MIASKAETRRKSRKMTKFDLQNEIDQNLEVFRQKLPELLKDHRNRFALLHNKEIVGIYDTIRDAHTTGDKLYPNKQYSIQQVTETTVNLGFYSYANCVG